MEDPLLVRILPIRATATYVPGSAAAAVDRQSVLDRRRSHSSDRTYGTPAAAP
ncbi:hypothetical protein ACFQ0B_12985 [Nonomuraea thailandensis]